MISYTSFYRRLGKRKIMLDIEDFEEKHVPEAAESFVQSYERERDSEPLIPKRDDLFEDVSSRLSEIEDRPGAAVLKNGELVGYMLETARADDFMGKRTAFSLGLYSHCSVGPDKEEIYQRLYEKLSRTWVKEGFHAHVVSIWACDTTISELFFRLGFGMTHFELMRDLSYPEGEDVEFSIKKLDSFEPIKELHEEEPDFYREAPLFWLLHNDEETEEKVEGELIAAFDEEEPVAYMHLERNRSETELLTDERTGCIAGAYARPRYRRKGVGTSLLRKAVEWAREKELERLYVEGESANIQGGNFWLKHFRPVVYTVRRCVDERI